MIDPATEIQAGRSGLLPGVLLVTWGVGFSFFREEFSPAVFWTLLVSVAILIIGVPSWLLGRRAKREYLESQNS